jgi:virginiamycin B lyase
MDKGVGRLAPNGIFTYYQASHSETVHDVIVAPDGTVWYTASPNVGLGVVPNTIGKIAPDGTVTEFPLPVDPLMVTLLGPTGIVVGPDGDIWVADQGSNTIDRVTPDGTLTQFSIPTGNSMPQGITVGSDGALWFIESNADRIGRISTSGTMIEYSIPNSNV